MNHSNESRNESADAQGSANKRNSVIQLGSRADEVLNERGALTNSDVLTMSQTQQKNGDVLGTLKGERFRREIELRVAAGETTITLDLSRDHDLSDETVEELEKLRDRLKNEKGVTLILTGLNAKRKRELTDEGMTNQDLTLVTVDEGAQVLAEQEKLAA